MKFLLIVLYIIFRIYLLESSEDVEEIKEIDHQRYGITFGQHATIRDYPYFSKLWVRKNGATYFCGGTIINCNTVLTAAHCVFNADLIFVCFGSDRCKSVDQCFAVRNMNDVQLHKGFVEALKLGQIYDDIATIKVPHSFCDRSVKNTKVAKLCERRPEKSCEVYAGVVGKTVGCGNTETGDTPTTLRQADQLIIRNKESFNVYSSLIRHSSKYNLCFTVSPKDSRTSSCIGDSGGPLILPNPKSKQMEVCAIVSFGFDNCTSGQPSGFTYINEYFPFIYSGHDSVPVTKVDANENSLNRAFQNLGVPHHPKVFDIWKEYEKNKRAKEKTSSNKESKMEDTTTGLTTENNKKMNRFLTLVNKCVRFITNLFQLN